MKFDWNLRLEILEIAHSWPYVFLACIIGSLLGWGVSLVLPTPYHAESELFVAYNADLIYRNPDDYKNWQLGELEAYIYSDDVLKEVLNRLQARDSYWDGESIQSVRLRLDTYWRNAGKWRLVVEADDPEQAAELATVWRNVALEKTAKGIEQARNTLLLVEQIRTFARLEANLEIRLITLQQTRQSLLSWVALSPASTASLSDLQRWRLLALASQGIEPADVARSLLGQFPSPDAGLSVYQDWAKLAAAALQTQRAELLSLQQVVQHQRQELTQNWEMATRESHNLTAGLTVERIKDVKPLGVPVRQPGLVALIGGALGLIAWGFIWLGRPIRRVAA